MRYKSVFNKDNFIWLSFVALGFVAVYVATSMKLLTPVISNLLMTIFISIITATSLNLIIGITGQFSLGHAAFMCIGAYSTGVCLKNVSGDMKGLLIGLAVGLVISCIFAIIISVPTLRLKGDYLAIATLGSGEIVRILINNMKITNGAAGLVLPKVVSLPFAYVVCVLCTVVILNFRYSSMGRACQAICQDEIATDAMGINTTKYKVLAFVIGAVIASVAGCLYSGSMFVIKPDMFGYAYSINILVVVVFGGMGSFTGSIISAIIIAIINQMLAKFASLSMIIYGLALIAIMIFRPGGLLGTKEFKISKYTHKKEAA